MRSSYEDTKMWEVVYQYVHLMKIARYMTMR